TGRTGSTKLVNCEEAAAACACALVTAALGTAGLAASAGTLSLAGTSFRRRLTAVRMVVRAWSFATGLVRINSAPRRKAVGRPARPSTMAIGIGLLLLFPRRQTSKISLAAGRFS